MTSYSYLQISTPTPHLHEQGFVETSIGGVNEKFYDGMSPSDIIVTANWELLGSPVKYAEKQWQWYFRKELEA